MTADLAARVVDLYRRNASAWDAARRAGGWRDRFWIEAFGRKVEKGGRVLDLGCGGGDPVARFLVDRGSSVTGVDASPELIALARERMPEQEWIVADMRGLELGRRFDAILAWDSFFHLAHDEQRAMFPLFDAHATDTAVLLFNTGPEHGEALSTTTFEGELLYHASLSPAEYRGLLDRSGFEVVSHAAHDPRGGGRTAWLCRRKHGR